MGIQDRRAHCRRCLEDQCPTMPPPISGYTRFGKNDEGTARLSAGDAQDPASCSRVTAMELKPGAMDHSGSNGSCGQRNVVRSSPGIG